MKKLTLSIFAIALCSLALCAAAQAQVKFTFVSNAGSDANDCLSAATACRTFQHGHDVVSAGGAVVAINSGGFGAVTISKNVTISGDGFLAGIGAAAGTAVTVTAGNVTLSGLYINGNGTATTGISVTGGSVNVLDSTITGFTTGVSAATAGKVYLHNCRVVNNTTGLRANGPGGCPYGLGGDFAASTVMINVHLGSLFGNTLAINMANPGAGCPGSAHGTNIFFRIGASGTDFTTDMPEYRNQSTNYLSVTGTGAPAGGAGSQVLIGTYQVANQGVQP